MDKIKGYIYFCVFFFSAIILGVGVWKNYRPQVIYASCADIAEKTSNLSQRKEIIKIENSYTFDNTLNECLSDAGYFENK